MEAKFISYTIDIHLNAVTERIKMSETFNRKELLSEFEDLLKEQQFKIDSATVEFKIIDDQVLITGMAVKDEEPKSIGFMSRK